MLQIIETVGLIALQVIGVCVAVILIISLVDRHPARHDDMAQATGPREFPTGDGGKAESSIRGAEREPSVESTRDQ